MRSGNFQPSQDDMRRFQAIRDSIQKAHGGKLSQEELRAEMRKIFAGRMSQRSQSVAQNVAKPKVTGDAMKFGITSNFPEYQKSAYIPSHEAGRGRLWILKSNGLLESVFVRTGLNDGRYTEITSPRLKPGDQVVLGASSAGGESEQARSPLMNQGGRMMGR